MKKANLLLILVLLVFALSSCDLLETTKEFTVGYEVNNGTLLDEVVVEEGSLTLAPSIPVKEGYEFIGWYSDEFFNDYFDFDEPVIRDLTLYAEWTPIEYSIFYYDRVGEVYSEEIYSYNDDLTGEELPDAPVETGYTFIEWDVSFPDNMPSTGIDIYATYTLNEYTVTYESNGGSVFDTLTLRYLEPIVLETPVIEGYLFDGWYTDSEFSIEFEDQFMTSSDLVLYAKWVDYDMNAKIVLITDGSDVYDASYNQVAWEGVVAFGDEYDISYTYYKPLSFNTTEYINSIDLAVANGAEIVVVAGFLFENAIWVSQNKYPEIEFIIVDGAPHNVSDWDTPTTIDGSEMDFTVENNTVAVYFAEHEVGFLAGYAAVIDGYTKLGFIGGMPVPALVRYGYGFIQGANYAAFELGLQIGSIEINYWYPNVFWPTQEVQSTAALWYANGTEVIFAAAGGAGNSVIYAAIQEEGKVIGVDVDQSSQSDTIITSAVKSVGNAVYQELVSWNNNEFSGGTFVFKDLETNCVELPMDTSRFDVFTQEQYDAIISKIVTGTVVVDGDNTNSIEYMQTANDYVVITYTD